MDKAKAIEFAESLGLGGEWVESSGGLVLSIPDSDAFAKAYSALGRSDEVELDPEGVAMADDDSVMRYVGGGFSIELRADFRNDSYYATIEEE